MATADLEVGQTVYVAREGLIGHVWPAMPSDTIGARLRHYRRAKHWSQTKLAEESGVKRQTIAEMERGAVTIPREPANIKALAKALGVSMRELAEPTGWYDDDQSSPDDDWQAWLRSLKIDEDGKASIARLIRLEIESAERRDTPTPNRQERPRRRAV